MAAAQSSSRRSEGEGGKRRMAIPAPPPSHSSRQGVGEARRLSGSQTRGLASSGAAQGAPDRRQGEMREPKRERCGTRTHKRSPRADEMIPPPYRRRTNNEEEAGQVPAITVAPIFIVPACAATQDMSKPIHHSTEVGPSGIGGLGCWVRGLRD